MAFGLSGSDNIEIRISVDNTGAVKVLGETEEKIKGVGKASQQAEKDAGSFFTSFAKGAGAALGAYVSFSAALKTIEIGSQVADVENAFKRLTGQIGVSADELQNRFSEALGGTLSSFETTRKANELLVAGINPDKFDELAQAARALADTLGIDTKQALDQVGDALLRGNDRALKAIGVHVDLTKANKDYADSVGKTVEQLSEAERLQASRSVMIAEMETQLTRLGKVENDAADNVAKIKNNLIDFRDEAAKSIAQIKLLNDALAILANFSLDDLKKEISTISLGFQTLFNVIKTGSWTTGYFKTLSEMMEQQRIKSEGLKKAQDSLTGSQQKHDQALNDLLDTTNAKIAKEKEEKELIDAMTKMYGKHTPAVRTTATAVKELSTAYADASAHVDEFKKAQEEATRVLEEAQKAAEAISNSMIDGIASSLGLALGDGLNSGDFRGSLAAAGKGIGTEVGTAIGESIGGPLGSFIGNALGEYVGGQLQEDIENFGKNSRGTAKALIDGMFGFGVGDVFDQVLGEKLFGDSKGTQIKKALDKILGDAYKDFTFSGNQDPTQGLFAGLGQQAQEQFAIAGDALTTFLGLSTSEGVNLGVVLANNNVHLSELAEIVESVGGSFESLANEMLMAFYEGELGVIALQDQLEELYGIMEGTSTFADLGAAAQAALNTDGRVLLNSIKAIGVEAQQLGAVTLPQMADILVNRFGMAASQVQIIMSSMTAAGINSVAQLAEATKLTSTAIAANIGMAQQGLTPNNTPVIPLASSTPKAGGGGGSTRSAGSGIDKAAGEAKRKAEQQKQAFLRLLNQVQNSAAGRALEKSIALGALTDGDYADKIRDLTDSAKVAQKALDDAENKYAATRNKGAAKQKKALEDLLKAQKNLDTLLGGATGGKSIDVNSGFISFAEKFAGNIQLIEKAAEAAGLKFDDMREKALKAFLSGDKTFSEAKALLADSNKGVAGKQGAVGEVLSRLLSRGESGGIFSIDDLKGLAQEARELGADTLEGLFEGLSGQGANQKDQQALSIALQNAGFTALDQLENISTDVAINVLDIMKQSGAAFGTTSQELRDIAKQIGDIPDSKRVTIQLDASISPEMQAILDRFNLLPEGFGQVTTQPYNDSSMGVNKYQAKYRKLLAAGRKADARRYKANHASYF